MIPKDLRKSSYDYPLPAERIAQHARKRGESRLLVIWPRGHREHRVFSDIVLLLEAGDLLILNDTRVIAARLRAKRPTGGQVEILITRTGDPRIFGCLARPARRLRPGSELLIPGAILRVISRTGQSLEMEIAEGPDLEHLIEKAGEVPLPPYIKRPPEPGDKERYQTVFARNPGSVAAPTAGLHFTENILEGLRERGVEIRALTLHVGPGTFSPVRNEDLRKHTMAQEHYSIPRDTAEAVLRAKSEGRRVVVCGTTATRALETWALGRGPREGWTGLFIYPGHTFTVPDALLTNFHLPCSTPLMLTAAFFDREGLEDAYREALRKDYMFGSYGDAMLIMRK